MTYRRSDISKNIKFVFAVGAFIALVFLFAFWGDYFDRTVSVSIINAANPAFQFFAKLKISVNHVADFFFDKVRLQEENDSLREMVANLKGNIEKLEIIERENIELKEMLNYPAGKKILAYAVFNPSYALNDTLILDSGRTAGIEVGMRVISPSGIFLGTISEVYDNSSKAALAASFGKETNVYFESSGVPAVAIGMGGEAMKILLPVSVSDVEVGERVLTLDGAGNLVGLVERIESKESDPVQKIVFRSPLNVRYLRAVLVF